VLLAESFYSTSVRITVKGIVQGVGFRPFVYREATPLRYKGFVCNTPEGVMIEAHGNCVTRLSTALRENIPERARIDSMEIEAV
jgi:hydrogenase maturation protein HypF